MGLIQSLLVAIRVVAPSLVIWECTQRRSVDGLLPWMCMAMSWCSRLPSGQQVQSYAMRLVAEAVGVVP